MQVNVGSAAFLTLQLSPDSPPLLPLSPVLGPCLIFSLSCIILSCFFAGFVFWFDIDFASFFFRVGSNLVWLFFFLGFIWFWVLVWFGFIFFVFLIIFFGLN